MKSLGLLMEVHMCIVRSFGRISGKEKEQNLFDFKICLGPKMPLLCLFVCLFVCSFVCL